MKYEWKKHEKDLYVTKDSPVLLQVDKQQFIMISGKGNPNNADFSNRVSVLYALAYAIKMDYKKSVSKEDDITDFTVYPLEGVWDLQEGSELIKDNLLYTIMIRQPDVITKDMVDAALQKVKAKKPNPLYEEIRFDTITEGKCIQVLHIGSFDDEPASFKKLDEFASENHLKRTKKTHREIYLNNANRVEKNKLKTILRYTVE